MAEREQWGSRVGFILAAVGSAIGLGNIWRFPYMAYENGGGAFLVPYIFAMLTAGIPFMVMEFGLGHRFRGSAPKVFASINKRWEWLGWFQVLVAAVISVYYVAVIGWTISYTGFAFTQSWGADPKGFFFGEFLGLTGGPLELGSLQPKIFAAVLLAWSITWLACMTGVKKGIERAGKVLMPVLFLMVVVLTVRVLSLDGAADGVNWLFKPDFSRLTDYKVWVAAYGQIFFSLSVGFAIMLAYSSYLPAKSDINNNAFMTVFINCGFSMMAGVMIFSVLGYMAAQQGVPIKDVAGGGVGLAFITIPMAINLMPMPAFFGTLFFLSLTMAGVSSHISIVEACISAFMDKFGWSRKKTTNTLCLVGFLVSLVFCMGGGLYVLDIVDHFINNFGILGCALMEIFAISWLCRLDVLRDHVNRTSEFMVGQWWNFSLRFLTVGMLGMLVISNFYGDIAKNYGGYDLGPIIGYGWAVVLACFALAFVLKSKSGRAGFAMNNDNSLRR
ncbi:sodium-dependent transporter [Desulfovibrio ferrophilus]|uniref:Transporter n=1 Tax=Desulfovibrio ferrophilus TaxID=241368 RepID=A0A2Z6B101_9BACT|nr:sodium-dependent transporter [Desulfovibrio ferrophilus]BBD09182.1 sodium:neurotransmitter symporter [Desulfovibrio ferrophilus]